MTLHSASLDPSPSLPIAQSPAFAAALRRFGTPAVRVTTATGSVLVLKRRWCTVGVGLVSRADLARPDLAAVARRADVRMLLLNPETASGAHGLAVQTPAHVAELDLYRPEPELRAGLQQKWRNRLVKAERSGLSVLEHALPPEAGHWLLEQEARQRRRRGYANWPEALTRAFATANPGQARVFEVRLQGDPVAGMLFLCHGAVATYHIGWTSAEGRERCGHHLAFWHAMLRFRARGMVRLDLGGIATDRAPGLARFKLGTGAAPRALGGSWVTFPASVRA